MLSAERLNKQIDQATVELDQVADYLVHGGRDKREAVKILKNWKKGLWKPRPETADVRRLATALGVDVNDLNEWRGSYRFAPVSADKARPVAEMIRGRAVQDALDILKFSHQRAASMMEKVLRSAIANADEQEADVENLYVSCARVDDAGVRLGTKRWMPKDRGRVHPIRRKACHIHLTVAEI
jgi:large subunit ribosomal protein L22